MYKLSKQQQDIMSDLAQTGTACNLVGELVRKTRTSPKVTKFKLIQGHTPTPYRTHVVTKTFAKSADTTVEFNDYWKCYGKLFGQYFIASANLYA